MTLQKPGLSLHSYFRRPFPSREGFSAYRMPGMAVHGPLILASSLTGFLLCWPHVMLRPLLIVWVLAGLYLGRDIAILCHYNPLLTLLAWAVSGFVLFLPNPIANFGRSHMAIPAAVSGAVGVVTILVAYAMTREKDSA
jgi:FtsH-binding integral membrane protein